ncbi:HET domain-containing protein [Colletotrichum lupini]|uniref:HET domain-containing protein n=1 Tax=Colletotrichum lupini TaxID=145971 RepID=A0A9Q8T4E5_9PEZI|nr:HET domain-containing protein [Colletotrichum lupini]UQC88600.1 HET domain-containing protein [Colletotrichum lupini]
MAPIMKFFYASLLAASTLTSAAFASPIDNTGVAIEARDVNFLAEGVEAPVSVEVTNSIAVRSVDEVDASLEKRFFTAPHIRRIFKVVAGNMISAASWAFNFWVEEDYTGKSTVWYSGVTGEGVSTPKIGVEGATFLSKTGTELDLKVPFIVKGFYAGKELIVHFVVRILSDAGETSVQYFYDRPTATIAGQNASVTSWDLVIPSQSVYREEGYAILSHRWQPSEIKFNEFLDHTEELKNGAGPLPLCLDKIRGACATARNKGYNWMWIDSCCIDKSSTTEETESINSMFKWYRDAKLCIVYLFDVEVNTTLAETELEANPLIFNRIGRGDPSEWFYRGWTLQEMLAPQDLEFYDTKWTYMGTRTELKVQLEKASGVSRKYLTGLQDFTKVCIAAKMSWMADRTTSREEDIAYSMLGIFNVFMTPQYGEGPRAFQRLQETILSSQMMDESLFAWRMPEHDSGKKFNSSPQGWAPDEWGLLAPSPTWKLAEEKNTRGYAYLLNCFDTNAKGEIFPC